MTFLFDHQAVSRNLLLTKQILRPSKWDLNQRVGNAIADATIPYRFKGDLNVSMLKIATNLIPIRKMHFLNFFQNKKTDNK